MFQVTDVLQAAAVLLGQTGTTAFTINGYDMGLLAINYARQYAEKLHDFKYAEANAYLDIYSYGGNITTATTGGSALAVVTGSTTPDATGDYPQQGLFDGYPLYQLIAAGFYVVWYDAAKNAYVVTTADNFGLGTGYTDYWQNNVSGSNPSGTYTHHGTYTGNLTVLATSISIKRVKYVGIPVAGGYEVVEFLTNDQFLSRVRIQTGRQTYLSTKTLPDLGAIGMVNPLCYQNAQTLYLAPASTFTFPVRVQLNVVQWMPAYLSGTDSDFFTQYGSEFLTWQTVIELNKYFKFFTVRQEGDLEEDRAIAMRDAALQSLINWDLGTEAGTSELPISQPVAAPQNG